MTRIAPRITVDPKIRFGTPVIEGTRIPIEVIVGKLASGMSADAVADAYGVGLQDVLAALAYAADVISHERVRAVSE
ncbi:MAG: DUF433 domain-containing protein [Acidobacteriota bacterium]